MLGGETPLVGDTKRSDGVSEWEMLKQLQQTLMYFK
jgi:hypothetical protein